MEDNRKGNRKKISALDGFVFVILGILGVELVGVGSCAFFVVDQMAAIPGRNAQATWFLRG